MNSVAKQIHSTDLTISSSGPDKTVSQYELKEEIRKVIRRMILTGEIVPPPQPIVKNIVHDQTIPKTQTAST